MKCESCGGEGYHKLSCSHNPDKQPKVPMAKRLTKQEKWNKASEDLINKMFEIAGHNVTYDDIKGRTDAWYTDWTMTVAQGRAVEGVGDGVSTKEYEAQQEACRY
jgi:hypothetical protein